MKTSKMMRLVALVLILALTLPTYGYAALPETAEPCVYTHIYDWNGYVTALGGGKIKATYWIDATGTMVDIGAETVQIYESTDNENWTWKTSYRLRDNEDMMGHGTDYYKYSVQYQGVAGRYYKAHMSLVARDASGEETRFFFTDYTQAT